jgi:DMSO/TMAO reductase YedYZ molybdopterin-dependent catalytic subunit
VDASRLPPGQQLAARNKWPFVGEKSPAARTDPWRIEIVGCVARPCGLSLDELKALPRVARSVDIHCVTRWSKLDVPFVGTTLAALLSLAAPTPAARFASFVARSDRAHSTSLPLAEALALDALVVWEHDGRPLEVEHGGPVRTIVPGRYFYKSVKWLERIELLEEDRLGFWEAMAGYHNVADPWREQRYLAPSLSRLEMHAILQKRELGGRDLRGLDAEGHDLSGLNAQGALLRDANFRRANLRGASFARANVTNAHFERADLRDVNFQNADAQGTDFRGADLRGANFAGASIFGATFVTPVESGQPREAASLDATTHLDAAAIDELTPDQQAFVVEGLRGEG